MRRQGLKQKPDTKWEAQAAHPTRLSLTVSPVVDSELGEESRVNLNCLENTNRWFDMLLTESQTLPSQLLCLASEAVPVQDLG